MFRNLPNVTKNLLLLNITVFVVALILQSNGSNWSDLFAAHYINSVLFEPYQFITHMFMHSLADPLHIFFNMFLLVSFGSHLERIWGAKRFFIFYIACGLGAFVLYNSIGIYQLELSLREVKNLGFFDVDVLNNHIREAYLNRSTFELNEYIVNSVQTNSQLDEAMSVLGPYIELNFSSIVGASGAIFGLLAGFAILFPNTELMILFLPIPIKAKYLIGAYLLFEIYNSIYQPGDQIAHLAHVGGALVGIIFILIWRRTDRKNFW